MINIFDSRQRVDFFEEKLIQMQTVANYKVYEDWTVYDIAKIVGVAASILVGLNYFCGATLMKGYMAAQWYRILYAPFDTLCLTGGLAGAVSACAWAVFENFLPETLDTDFIKNLGVSEFLRIYGHKITSELDDFWSSQEKGALLHILHEKIEQNPQESIPLLNEPVSRELAKYWGQKNNIFQREIEGYPFYALLQYRSIILSTNRDIPWQKEIGSQLLDRIVTILDENPLQFNDIDARFSSEIMEHVVAKMGSLDEWIRKYQAIEALPEGIRDLPWHKTQKQRIVELIGQKIEPDAIQHCSPELLRALVPVLERNVRDIPLLMPQLQARLEVQNLAISARALPLDQFLLTYQDILTGEALDFWETENKRLLLGILLEKLEANPVHPPISEGVSKSLQEYWCHENNIPDGNLTDYSLEELLRCRRAILTFNHNIPWQQERRGQLLDAMIEQLDQNPRDLDEELTLAISTYFSYSMETLNQPSLEELIQMYQNQSQLPENRRNLPWHISRKQQIVETIAHKIDPSSLNQCDPVLLNEVAPILRRDTRNIPFIVSELQRRLDNQEVPVGETAQACAHALSMWREQVIVAVRELQVNASQMQNLEEKQQKLYDALCWCMQIQKQYATVFEGSEFIDLFARIRSDLSDTIQEGETALIQVRILLARSYLQLSRSPDDVLPYEEMTKIFPLLVIDGNEKIDAEDPDLRKFLAIMLSRYLYTYYQTARQVPTEIEFLMDALMAKSSVSLQLLGDTFSTVAKAHKTRSQVPKIEFNWPKFPKFEATPRSKVIQRVFQWAMRGNKGPDKTIKGDSIVSALEVCCRDSRLFLFDDVRWLIQQLQLLPIDKKLDPQWLRHETYGHIMDQLLPKTHFKPLEAPPQQRPRPPAGAHAAAVPPSTVGFNGVSPNKGSPPHKPPLARGLFGR